jgi:hypothetical protein
MPMGGGATINASEPTACRKDRRTVAEQARRLHGFLAGYAPFDPTGFVDVLAARVRVMADHLLTDAARGNERLRRLVERLDAARHAADPAHIEAHRDAFHAALPDGAQVRRAIARAQLQGASDRGR